MLRKLMTATLTTGANDNRARCALSEFIGLGVVCKLGEVAALLCLEAALCFLQASGICATVGTGVKRGCGVGPIHIGLWGAPSLCGLASG